MRLHMAAGARNGAVGPGTEEAVRSCALFGAGLGLTQPAGRSREDYPEYRNRAGRM